MKNPIRVCESLKEDCMLRKCPLPPSSRFQHARRPGAKSRAVSTFPNGSDLQAPGTAVGGGALPSLSPKSPHTFVSHLPPPSAGAKPGSGLGLLQRECLHGTAGRTGPSGHFHVSSRSPSSRGHRRASSEGGPGSCG